MSKALPVSYRMVRLLTKNEKRFDQRLSIRKPFEMIFERLGESAFEKKKNCAT